MLIELPCFGMRLNIVDGSGWIESDLSKDRSSEHETPTNSFDAAIDGIESLILAIACEGRLNVADTSFVAAIETAVFSAMNEYGE